MLGFFGTFLKQRAQNFQCRMGKTTAIGILHQKFPQLHSAILFCHLQIFPFYLRINILP